MKDENKIEQSESNRETPTQVTVPVRRQVLGSGAAGAAAVLLGAIAVACGSDDSSVPGSAGQGGSAGKGNAGSAGKTGSAGKGGALGAGEAGAGGQGNAAGSPEHAGAGGSPESAGAGGEAGAPAVADADIVPLNALLSAEYSAITAYTAGAGLIGNAPTSDPLYALRQVIIDIAVAIQAQHQLHAQALVDAIGVLGGTPVKQADIAAKFAAPSKLVANPTIGNVLKFAASAERGAAVAYNQVLAGLEDAKLRFLASSIEGDESQHFIALTALVLGLVDPGANLSSATAVKVVPEPFVATVGTQKGLDTGMPVDYFP